MSSLIFSTGNSDKFLIASEIAKIYNIDLKQVVLDVDEIQSEDSVAITIDKSVKAYELIKKPVLVSDDSWRILGLSGFPGAYMKSVEHWFELKDFLNLTRDLENRQIILENHLAYNDGRKVEHFVSKSEGELLKIPRGDLGPSIHKIVSMNSDKGMSISEVFENGAAIKDHAGETWHEFAKWFTSKDD